MRTPEMYVWDPGRTGVGSQRSEVRKIAAAALWGVLLGIIVGYGWLFIHLGQQGG